MVIRGCPQITLCGISSRFQLLSPTERQVSHALLTRSPLSNLRRNYPVRLACVRHAASVRPEPGSNSQKFVSKLHIGAQIKFLNKFVLANITQEFSLAVFISSYTRFLKQSINCPRCYSLSCIIQFTRYRLFSAVLCAAANFDILTLRTRKVNLYFLLFSLFFFSISTLYCIL